MSTGVTDTKCPKCGYMEAMLEGDSINTGKNYSPQCRNRIRQKPTLIDLQHKNDERSVP